MSAPQRVTTRNARFQQWEALLANRTKRHRLGELLVQGVRPITLAVEHGWRVRTLLHDGRSQTSAWADRLWDGIDAERFLVAPELMAELGGKEESPELLAVVEMPDDDLARLGDRGRGGPVVVFDRPSSPGNLGTLARSADAFGAAGLVVTGHAADPYDPRCVRASTGSLFALTVVRAAGHAPVVEWAHEHGYRIVGTDEAGPDESGTDESGTVDLEAADLRGRVVLVVGNEHAGLSQGWLEACDEVASIPMSGSASSLNAATAGSLVLYAAMRQRRG